MVKSIAAATGIAALLIGATVLPAAARGGHGLGHHFGGHGFGRGFHSAGTSSFASSGKRTDDPYVKAASDELDKLLDTKMKSICRGC